MHVQKTGGVSVETALARAFPDAERVAGLPGRRHAGLADALEAEPGLAGYFTFGFVRNPWARMHSWHSMVVRRKAAADAGDRRLARQLRVNEFWAGVARELLDFEDFVLRGPDLFERLRTPQLHYLTAPGRRADLIGRTETLAADLARVFERLGVGTPGLPRKNTGPPTDYRAAYTPAMRDRIAEVFAADIEEFGYRF